MKSNDVLGRLGIRFPIIQGPFGGGLSTTRLAALVSGRGGLGSYGAHMLAPGEIDAVVKELRALAREPFAINLWVSDHDPGALDFSEAALDRAFRLFEPYFRELGLERPKSAERVVHRFEEQVEALLEAAPPVFSFVFGVPTAAILEKCRERGIVTLGAATSVAEAQALETAGVDLIVATGMEAGGHRPSFLARAEDALMGTFALTQLVADRVRIPVIAAGGIADGRGIRAAMTLGAQAAQIGTAFLACEESGATAAHRDLLFGERALHTTLTRAFTGRLARGIENRWTREMAARGGDFAPYPFQSWFVSLIKRAAPERVDLLSLWSGQIAPNLRHRDATSLMQGLCAELEAA